MATPVKEIQITGTIEPKNAGDLVTVVGRIKHVPGKNAIWAKDLKLTKLHALIIPNHSGLAGTFMYAQIVPIPSVGTGYGSLPTRDNYASVYMRSLKGTVAITAGTMGYIFVAYGE
jgi:hypothetical protein